MSVVISIENFKEYARPGIIPKITPNFTITGGGGLKSNYIKGKKSAFGLCQSSGPMVLFGSLAFFGYFGLFEHFEGGNPQLLLLCQ